MHKDEAKPDEQAKPGDASTVVGAMPGGNPAPSTTVKDDVAAEKMKQGARYCSIQLQTVMLSCNQSYSLGLH